MKRVIIAALALAAMAGCTKVDELDSYNSSDDGSVAFSITNIEATRATPKVDWATTGDVVGISTSNNDLNVPYEVKVVTDQSTTTTTLTAQSDKIYYASHDQEMNFVSYYPYSATNSAATVAIDVATSQTDLLVSKVVTSTEKSGADVAFTFYHALSYVEIALTSSDMIDLSSSSDLKIYIGEVPTTATYNLFEQSLDLGATTSTVDFEIKESNGDYTASAIVLPNDYTNVTLYFSFTDDNGTPRLHYKALGSAFSSGFKYTYTATVGYDAVELKLDDTIDWSTTDVDASTSPFDIVYNPTDDLYEIHTALGLQAFANLVNGTGSDAGAKTYGEGFAAFIDNENATTIDGKLMKNIDLSTICGKSIVDGDGNKEEVSWTPIGESANHYSGTFDGNGFEVSGLYINNSTKLGLFAYIGTDGELYNIGVSGSVTGSTTEVGGLVGWNEGFVINCYSLVNVQGGNNVGGIAGFSKGNIANCYNRGNVKGTNNIGGIVGQNFTGGYVGYSYSTGEITGTARYGGVVGWNYTTSPTDAPTIKGCFSMDNTPYSIGQLGYASASGPYSGNVCSEEYLKSAVFATIIENGAHTYNEDKVGTYHAIAPIEACAWRDNSTYNYPTLDFGVETNMVDWIYDIVYNSGIYDIYTAKGLEYFAALVNGTTLPASSTDVTDGGVVTSGGDAYFKSLEYVPQANINGSLLCDKDVTINLSELSSDYWTPIGNSTNTYKGTFVGNNRSISGLNIDSTSDNYQGFFGYVEGATISGICIVDGSVEGYDYVGGVVGYATASSISGCYNKANIEGSSEVGGVVGSAYNSSTVSGCYNDGGDVSGGSSGYIGGVVGRIKDSTVSGCYNNGGGVSGDSDSYIGGVVGSVSDNSTLTSCYSYGAVSCSSSTTKIGGVAGLNSSTITYCYYDKSTVGDTNPPTTAVGGYSSATADSGNVEGLDKATMQSQATVDLLNNGAYIYNQTATYTIGAWVYSSGAYPTIDASATPALSGVDIAYSNGIYEIYTAEGLKAFANLVNGVASDAGAVTYGDGFASFDSTGDATIAGKLMANIDLSTVCSSGNGNWTPIGNDSNQYSGEFDGNSFEVQNIYIDSSSSDYQGLFGYISGANAKISNLGVVGGSIKGNDNVGGIAGCAYNYATITECYNTADVEGNSGIGGIAGYAENSATITGCYNTGNIVGSDYIGGITGWTYMATLTSCYSCGEVSGSSSITSVGGVVGVNSDSSSITYCYYDISTIGSSTYKPSYAVGSTANTTDVTGLTEEMTNGTLYGYLNTALSDTWKAVTNGYPILIWQSSND